VCVRACVCVCVCVCAGYLRLGQNVIQIVAVVNLGVCNGSGDGGSCFGIEVCTDTGELANMVIARFGDR